ncbi:penicillin-insensitive murein endopeptidase [Candidatus Entotheonella palauensis]|uniref:penicillin-insensitive murein endopeptidase n=1 Tax=Candidatus Entotheonella palauensis TaxID=93172 RepID=UPI0015C474EF|nr:penicillin-insensitive murein endopeptidase [Candidatus Entotheonella palauensis]
MQISALKWVLILGLSAGLSTPVAARSVKRWHDKMPPAPGAPRSIGAYTSGCIQGAQALPSTGPGFQTIRRSRQRFFGHPSLIQYIRELGHIMDTENLGILSIGDLGQARGGPMPYAHLSHQTGLDVDMWFWLQPKSRPMTPAERETAQPPSMIANGRLALHPKRWTSRQMRLMEAAASFESVERIFVTPTIKQALCKAFPGAAWLRKVRPWWGHRAHLHVRLRCPHGDPACVSQPPPPEGTGCDATLAWWFTDEARRPSGGKSKPVPMPEACQAVLAQ